MAVIHMSQAEASSDFEGLMAKVSAGKEVVIEQNSRPVAIVRPLSSSGDASETEELAFAHMEKKQGIWVLRTGLPVSVEDVNEVIDQVRRERDFDNLYPRG